METALLVASAIILGAVIITVGAALTISSLPRPPSVPSEGKRAELEAARRFCLGPCRGEAGTCPLVGAGLSQRSCPLWRSLQERLHVEVPWAAIA